MTVVAVLAAVVVAGMYFWPLLQQRPPSVKVYFYKGDKLFAIEREIKAGESPAQKALGELLAGPNPDEKLEGITTQLPAGTRVLRIRVKGHVAIVDFNRKLETYGGGSARLEGMIAQIVYTATEIPGVEKVWIWMEGEKEVVLGGEGLVLDRPLSRRDVSY